MTTKRELRDAMQRLADACEACGHAYPLVECAQRVDERRHATEAARAILARPARVAGYRYRSTKGAVVDIRHMGFPPRNIEECYVEADRLWTTYGGTVRKLVVR